MATIRERKLPSGRRFWFLDHGKGRERLRIKAGDSRAEAQLALSQFNEQLALHGAPPASMTVTEAVERYDKFLSQNRRRKTQLRYVRVLRTFADCYLAVHHPDVVMLRDVRPAHVTEYKALRADGQITDRRSVGDRRREQELRLEIARNRQEGTATDKGRLGWLGRHGIRAAVTHRTINYELRALTTFFRWAIKQNYAFIDPAKVVERFRLSKRSIPRFMTSEDLRKFFGACDDLERRLFMTILLTGMRKGEAEHLCWSDINFELGVIFIQEKPEFDWQPKTDERIIPVSPVLNDVLLDHWKRRRGDKLAFPNEAGNVDTHILERLKRVCVKAGIRPGTVHGLRHSFGAHLRMAGVNLADIADLMGHRDLATTQIYAKVVQEHLREAAGKLATLVDETARKHLPDLLASGKPLPPLGTD